MEIGGIMNNLGRYITWRRVLALSVLLVLCILLFITRLVLTVGTVVITTNNASAEISLLKTDRDGHEVTIKKSTGTLSAKVAAGSYTAAAHSNLSSAQQTVTVTAREKSQYSINFKDPTPVQSVLPDGAASLIADDSKMLYINTSDNLLYQLDNQGVPRVLDSLHAFKSIKWADVSYGVGQDSENKLHEIINGVVSDLQVPFTYTDGLNISYAVSAAGQFYVSADQTVYSANRGEALHQIYTTKSEYPSLYASYSGVLAIKDYEKGPTNNAEQSGESGGEEAVLTILSSGQKIASKDIESSELAWSQDGKYLAVVGDTSNDIYDTHLNKLTSLHQGNSTNMVWLDASTLLYSSGGTVWSYSPATEQSSVVATMPQGGSVAGVYPSGNGTKIYVTSTRSVNNSKEYVLYGADLTTTSSSIPDYAITLGIFFPTTANDCSFSYTNFVKPVLLVTAWSNQDACRNQAINELNSDSLPADKFSIIFIEPLDE
jgi:hypothetical protein